MLGTLMHNVINMSSCFSHLLQWDLRSSRTLVPCISHQLMFLIQMWLACCFSLFV